MTDQATNSLGTGKGDQVSKFNEAINYIAGELQKRLPDDYSVHLAIDNDEVDLTVYDGESDIIEVYPNCDCGLANIMDAIENHQAKEQTK